MGILSAVVLTVLWAVHARAPHPAQTGVTQSTPPAHVFTTRLIPSAASWTPPQVRAVARASARVFDSAVFPESTGVVIEDARTGATLFARNPNGALVPASVLKLVAAATALRELGPTFRFTTRLVAGEPVQGDTIRGDLWLVGTGDPELKSADLLRAAAAVRDAGVSRIEGDVVADGNRFGPDAVNPAWAADDLEYGYAALTSAVTMDGGTAQFTITPDADGGAANVRVDPESIAGALVGAVRTGSADADNTLRIDPLPDGSGFQLSGTIPYGASQKYWRSLAHPTLSAAVVLRTMLTNAGIAVDGGPTIGSAPIGATSIWTHRSRPLTAIIKRMMFDSDNHIAEQLIRAAGAERFGSGALANGLAAEGEYLHEIGQDQTSSVLADGSGLSTANRLSANTVAAVLRDLVTGRDGGAFSQLLPRVGMEGTVHVRNLAPDVRGRVLGKDGYIEGVSSIAGYVNTAHHGLLIYAFLVNGWSNGLDAVWSGEDDLLSQLARL
ncbi:MAG TPA: D-alanyl-D-alanine carboxypeptidase/D-alanyl-D-alanine-endopeptidase [Candidatus Eremiobacteraceae bacterium]|nr:D-alanyl-D-alanine carboxypeptidase/D-alanyl-D-alanine-endopeptidase [Candidatus Eremiobacteraceae bacterium]